MSVVRIAKVKNMNPALIAPFWSVYIDSDGSIGETVVPMIRHWMKWATMRSVRVMSAAALHRLVRDLRIPPSGTGEFARTGSSILRFSPAFWPSQPLFIGRFRDLALPVLTEVYYYTRLD